MCVRIAQRGSNPQGDPHPDRETEHTVQHDGKDDVCAWQRVQLGNDVCPGQTGHWSIKNPHGEWPLAQGEDVKNIYKFIL